MTEDRELPIRDSFQLFSSTVAPPRSPDDSEVSVHAYQTGLAKGDVPGTVLVLEDTAVGITHKFCSNRTYIVVRGGEKVSTQADTYFVFPTMMC